MTKPIVIDPTGNPEGLDYLHHAHFRAYAKRLRDAGGYVSAEVMEWLADQIEAQTAAREVGTLIEFAADGRQYLIAPHARGKFLDAGTATKRLQLAELVVDDGRVVKNRNGRRTDA